MGFRRGIDVSTLLACAVALGCGQDDERVADMFGDGGGMTDDGGEPGGDDGDDGNSGDDDGGAGDSGDGGTSGDGGGNTGGGGTTSTTGGGAGGSTGTTTYTGIKYDVGDGGGGGGDPGNCECGNLDWSYVFIANSQEGTISKINTRTLQEEGRYATGGTSPSRTSVSIDGKAVVVANRGVGVAKYWTRTDLCDPMANGQPGLQTSTGKNDVYAFGEDDCLAWFQDMSTAVPGTTMTVQRPVQWTSGDGECHSNQRIWTTTGAGGLGPTMCGPQGVWVHLINGSDGGIEQTIHIPETEFNCDHTNTGQGVGLGPYGGAVDSNNNFFFHGWGNNKLVRVDFQTRQYTITNGGGYGITTDSRDRVWLSSSISRYDPTTGDRQYAGVSTSGGIAQDLDGRIWAAGQNGVVWVDMDTMAIGDSVPLPVTNQVKGVSVDIDGFIWAVAQDDTKAYKIDPTTYQYEFYDGLDGPYTYSDMTGGAVYNINCVPPPQ